MGQGRNAAVRGLQGRWPEAQEAEIGILRRSGGQPPKRIAVPEQGIRVGRKVAWKYRRLRLAIESLAAGGFRPLPARR